VLPLRLAAVAAAVATLTASSCDPTHAPVTGIGVTLGPPGGVAGGVLTVGDRDTLRAQAYTRGWPSIVKYDSESEPTRFTYSSSDPGVATVTAEGVVFTTGTGTTQIRASVDGVVSQPMQLDVVPVASALRAAPSAIDAAVGDTMVVTVTAVDDAGADVAGILFTVAPDTSYWAVIDPPVEYQGRLATPSVLHVRAKQPGTVHLLAYALNERPAARLEAPPVAITVHAAP
jgi:hypothetical protein